jgi:hypothetical protein
VNNFVVRSSTGWMMQKISNHGEVRKVRYNLINIIADVFHPCFNCLKNDSVVHRKDIYFNSLPLLLK